MKKIDLTDRDNYFYARGKYEKTFANNLRHGQRLKLHPLLLLLIHIKNKRAGFQIKLLENNSIPTDRPKIFCVTHIGKFDIEVVSEIIKEHYYLLSGDFENIHSTIEEKFLGYNGVIYVREDDKEDRKLSKEKMVNILKNRGNIMYFPEGTWNLSPNLPVVKCSYGIIDVAMKAKAVIVPIAIEQYGKQFLSVIGQNFEVKKYSDDKKIMAIEDLRGNLAGLKWKIWESVQPCIRKDISKDEFESFINERLKEWPNFTLNEFLARVYKPKGIEEPEKVFDFFKSINLKKENAFLAKSQVEYHKRYL